MQPAKEIGKASLWKRCVAVNQMRVRAGRGGRAGAVAPLTRFGNATLASSSMMVMNSEPKATCRAVQQLKSGGHF